MTIERIVAGMTDRPPRAPWKVKDMLWASLAATLFIGIGAVILVILYLIARFLGWSGTSTTSFAILILALEAVLLVPAWVWGPSKYGGGWRALGLRRFKFFRAVLLVVISLVLVIVSEFAWELARERLGWADQGDILSMFGGGISGLLMALLLGGVLVPIAEEVFFRGFLYAGMRERWGTGWALVVSALIFALIHLTPGVLPPLFVIGLLLAYLYERTDSLWPSILLHAVINSMAFISLYLTTTL